MPTRAPPLILAGISLRTRLSKNSGRESSVMVRGRVVLVTPGRKVMVPPGGA